MVRLNHDGLYTRMFPKEREFDLKRANPVIIFCQLGKEKSTGG
jgi:hypothetical protein